MFTSGSLFSGAAGMTRGFERAGFATRWHAEVDKDASSVLRRHYRDTPNLGSVEDIHGGRIEPVDVMEGGSPCQDVSKAGTRAGLDGKRSGLFFEYVRIVREMREATNGRYPAVVVLENVDGLLSSNRGRDFAVVLGRLQELGAAVAYRVLDAQFFGVPQRRRRVFLVADFAPVGVGEERAAQVLALRESLCRHPAPGDEARQGAARAAQDGARVGGEPIGYSENFDRFRQNDYAPAVTCQGLRPSQNAGGMILLEPFASTGDVASTILCRYGKGADSDVTDTLIVAPWDEAQITSAANRSRVENGSPAPTLNGSGQVSIVAAEVASTVTGEYGQQAYHGDGSDNLIAEAYAPDVAATLSSGSHASHAPGRRREDDTNLVALAFNWQAGGGGNDDSFRGKSRQYICRAGDYCGALGVTRQDAVALGFHPTLDPISAEDLMPCLGAHDAMAVAFQDSQSETRIGQCLGTLDSNYGSRRRMGIFERYGLKWIVRRLTPKEGERLQGWPDDWTRWRHDGQQISDSARWRLIGNGVATPVAYWIAKRLRAAMEAS